jgi:hypothetical protein
MDYDTAIRKSIEMDRPKLLLIKKPKEQTNDPKAPRIKHINPRCEYARYARLFVGRKVEKIRDSAGTIGNSTTGYYRFIFDDDRKAVNKAAGWSDFKTEYLLEKPELIYDEKETKKAKAS